MPILFIVRKMPETNFPQTHIPALCAGKKSAMAQKQIILAHRHKELGNEDDAEALTQNQKRDKKKQDSRSKIMSGGHTSQLCQV